MPNKILVVDDEPDMEHLIRQKFRKKIQNKSLEFIFSINGEQALEVLKNNPDIDIVLSDINMPVMDGLTFLSKVREINQILKTVIISAYGDMDNIRTAMNLDAFDFLLKPIDFHDLEITIEKTRKHVNQLKQAKEQIDDLNAAQKIQRSILPNTFPQIEGLDIAAGYQPMNIIGGDFYDFHVVDDKHLGALIADVSGHGVQAAIVASMVKIAFSLQHQYASDPVKLLEGMNTTLTGLLNESFLTAIYLYIDTENMTMKIGSAAHPPLFIMRKKQNSIDEIKANGRLMGWFPVIDCKKETTEIHPGDRIILYTDGITEALDSENRYFGDHQFEGLIKNEIDRSPSQFIFTVFEHIGHWVGEEHSPDDDLTMVVIDVEES